MVTHGFSVERAVLCVILGGVLLREVGGALKRFKPSQAGEWPRPQLFLFPIVPLVLFYQALFVPLNAWRVAAGCAGLLASLALFEWALRASGREFFSWAGSEDTPQFLCESGPYAYIRNPFYASYLLGYAAAAVALLTVTSLVILLVMTLLFWRIARFEEDKFAHSPVADRYAHYRRRTGRFLPRLHREPHRA